MAESTKESPQAHWLRAIGPTCLIVKAHLKPVGDLTRFQPAGFPEIGHVIYDAPTSDGGTGKRKICIVDSPASMANHLESVCMAGPTDTELQSDLTGLPYVVCVTDSNYTSRYGTVVLNPDDPKGRVVVTSLTEGHRIASDYFLSGRQINNGNVSERNFRDVLREGFHIIEIKRDKTYFIPPETWWSIYKTIFRYDPNSLVHGVLFAREQVKISRFLTAHHEAIGASRVGRSGVKFDRLGKTTSGQPIFAVDEETAQDIYATFILDLAMLRSFGRGQEGLAEKQKRLLLDLALWKIKRLLERPFRYRAGCHLACDRVTLSTDSEKDILKELPSVDMQAVIRACEFGERAVTRVYFPADELFKSGKEQEETGSADGEGEDEEAVSGDS
jgi:CRISPR-associated protein Csb1